MTSGITKALIERVKTDTGDDAVLNAHIDAVIVGPASASRSVDWTDDLGGVVRLVPGDCEWSVSWHDFYRGWGALGRIRLPGRQEYTADAVTPARALLAAYLTMRRDQETE